MTEADWIKIIREFPADPFHRLGFSDWLEDEGQGERAELIRQTCKGERRLINLVDGQIHLIRGEWPSRYDTLPWDVERTLRNHRRLIIQVEPDEARTLRKNEGIIDVTGWERKTWVCLWNCVVTRVFADRHRSLSVVLQPLSIT